MITDNEKLITHSVDTQAAMKIKNTRKLKQWLKLHPNYTKYGDKWIHIYESTFVAWYEQQANQQKEAIDA